MSVDFVGLSGILTGALCIIFTLSVLIGAGFREPSLIVLSMTALLGILCLRSDMALAFHELVLALSLCVLILVAGYRGALRWPAICQLLVAIWALLLAIFAGFFEVKQFAHGAVLIAFSLSWLFAVAWGLKRMWRRALPWVSWLLAGFVFIYAGFVLYAVFLPQLVRWTNWTIEQAHEFWVSFHITLYCLCTYIGLVWRSRLISESRLRAGSYETVDPLTGCMTPLAFELAVKQSAQRSYSLGYRSAVLLIKNANHEIFTKTFSSDNPELGVLMTSELVRRNCRSHDAVCRMKDNVFVVLMDGVQNAAFLKLQASKILAASLRLQRPHAPDEAMKLQIFGTFLPTEQQNIAHWLSRLIEEWGKAKHDASGTAIVVRESLNRSSIPGVSHE